MAIFLSHVNVVLSKLRETPITALSTDTASVAYYVQTAVQRAIARVWNAKQWTFKQRKTTRTTANGTSEYTLSKLIGEPYILLSTGSPYILRPVSEDEFDSYIPNPTASGNPQLYMLYEVAGVETQPTATAALVVVSSSASDTTQSVTIKGLVSGQVDYETVALNGTTNVTTTKQFDSILSVGKSAYTAGRVTITESGVGTTLVVMGPLETVVRYKKMRLYPTPSSTLTITIKHFAQPNIPTSEYEDAEIPARWDYVVEQYAFALALQSKGRDQADEATIQFQLAEKYLNEDMAAEEKQSSAELIVPRRALDTGTLNDGFLRSSTDGLSFEEIY